MSLEWQSVKARALHVLARAGDFDESKHPRGQPGNAGQFGPGGGGDSDSSSGESDAAKSDEETYVAVFSKSEKDAIGTYIDDSTALNKYYRSGKGGNAEFDKMIGQLNSALKKSEASSDLTLWRGMSGCKIARELRREKNAEKLVGKSVPLGGFQSTSLSQEVALDFIGVSDSPIVLEISVRKGTHMINMMPFAENFAKQQEQLLGHGTLTITGAERPWGKRGPLYLVGNYSEGS